VLFFGGYVPYMEEFLTVNVCPFLRSYGVVGTILRATRTVET
jgi:hypothetical protein